jgi:hypothetical protein
MIHHLFDTAWHRRPPLLSGKSDLDKQVSLHLVDVNSRNGWNITEPLSRLDHWVPWIVAVATCLTVIIVKWWM